MAVTLKVATVAVFRSRKTSSLADLIIMPNLEDKLHAILYDFWLSQRLLTESHCPRLYVPISHIKECLFESGVQDFLRSRKQYSVTVRIIRASCTLVNHLQCQFRLSLFLPNSTCVMVIATQCYGSWCATAGRCYIHQFWQTRHSGSSTSYDDGAASRHQS